jgi:hypothetical protein
MSGGSQRGLRNGPDARSDGPTAIVVWHEVLLAYFAPAAVVGTAALITRQRELGIAAPTSIAGTSALVAALLASWLRGHGATDKRIARTTRRRLVATCAIASITAGLVTAAIVAGLLPSAIGFRRAPWLARTWLDLPLSAGISAAIVSWRWRSALDRRRPAPT